MNIKFNSKLFSLLFITSILLAFPIDKKSDIDGEIFKAPIPTESRVIIGKGAKIIVETNASAKLWYDEMVLLHDAKFIEDKAEKPNVSEAINNTIEISEPIETSLPTELSISKAYPNPFNPIVNISYGLPESAAVKIVIYDLTGRKITEYGINQQSAGWHEFNWNALDQYGQTVGSGIYLMTVQAGNMIKKQKITFLK